MIHTQDENYTIHLGNCHDVLDELPENSVEIAKMAHVDSNLERKYK